MKLKFVFPDDPKQRLIIYRDSLEQVLKVQSEVKQQQIQANQEFIDLKLRSIRTGEDLGTEISACKKKELNIKMAILALAEQRKSLEEAIASHDLL
jgi:hypothetical protein